MNKLLVICGPTATGKSDLAFSLSKVLAGELISADSRQVYKGMDIGTGKDKERVGPILGYDLVDPKKEFSVAQYIGFAKDAIEKIWRNKKLPIVVGGTGLYIKALVDGIQTVDIPRNDILRAGFDGKTVEELFDTLSQVDSVKAASLNSSDKKNPRRIIRAIEIAIDKSGVKGAKSPKINADVLFVGLTASKETLNERIEKRVVKRIYQGIEREIENLLKTGVSWDSQAMQSLGYRQFRGYFEGEQSIDEVEYLWAHEEQKYIKRQITWFKKDNRINWFDITDPNYKKKVERLVKKWYSKAKSAKKN